jgi:hypothetical protein
MQISYFSFGKQEIAGMYDTAIELLPAPGQGLCYAVDKVSFISIPDNTLIPAQPAQLYVEYGSKPGSQGLGYEIAGTWAQYFLTPEAKEPIARFYVAKDYPYPFSEIENAPVSLSNGLQPYIIGENSKVNIILWYDVINLYGTPPGK